MTPDEIEQILAEARGYCDLGMFEEAWGVLEALPYDGSRVSSHTVALRFVICTELQKWALGADLLRMLSGAQVLQDRRSSGLFCLAHAEALFAAGDVEGARRAMNALAIIWPEGRGKVLGRPEVLAMWP